MGKNDYSTTCSGITNYNTRENTMTQQDEIVQTIKVLREEVEVLTSRLRSAGTGYLHTAIDVINSRIDELIGAAITPYFNDPDPPQSA